MIACGYRYDEWMATDPVVRGRLAAHVMEKSLREAYEAERASQKETPKGRDPLADLHRAFGVGT